MIDKLYMLDGRHLRIKRGTFDLHNSEYNGEFLELLPTFTPTLSITESLTAFEATATVPSDAQTYSISGSNVFSILSIACSNALFQVSKDGVTWSRNVDVVPDNGTIDQTIYVRLNSGASGNYTGIIVHETVGFFETIDVTGEILGITASLRLPTETEWQAEINTWLTGDAAGAFGSPLKLPVGGIRNFNNGTLINVNSYGYYWGSTVDETFSQTLRFYSGEAVMTPNFRALGLSVRLILDGTYTQAQFDEIEATPVLIGTLGYGWCYNPTTQRIWLDRNLGATQVATSSTDSAAYGWLFQWGRAAEGHQIRTSTLHDGEVDGLATTSEPDTGAAWDGKFITINTTPYDWLATQDDSLWQGVDGDNVPK